MTTVKTRKDFFRAWASKTGKTQKELKEVYDALVEVVQEAAKAEEETKVILPKIGNIIVYTKPPHLGMNNLTKEPKQFGPTRKSYVRLYKSFKDNL